MAEEDRPVHPSEGSSTPSSLTSVIDHSTGDTHEATANTAPSQKRDSSEAFDTCEVGAQPKKPRSDGYEPPEAGGLVDMKNDDGYGSAEKSDLLSSEQQSKVSQGTEKKQLDKEPIANKQFASSGGVADTGSSDATQPEIDPDEVEPPDDVGIEIGKLDGLEDYMGPGPLLPAETDAYLIERDFFRKLYYLFGGFWNAVHRLDDVKDVLARPENWEYKQHVQNFVGPDSKSLFSSYQQACQYIGWFIKEGMFTSEDRIRLYYPTVYAEIENLFGYRPESFEEGLGLERWELSMEHVVQKDTLRELKVLIQSEIYDYMFQKHPQALRRMGIRTSAAVELDVFTLSHLFDVVDGDTFITSTNIFRNEMRLARKIRNNAQHEKESSVEYIIGAIETAIQVATRFHELRRGLHDQQKAPAFSQKQESKTGEVENTKPFPEASPRLPGLYRAQEHVKEWVAFSKWNDKAELEKCWKRIYGIKPQDTEAVDSLPAFQIKCKQNPWNFYLEEALKEFRKNWPHPTHHARRLAQMHIVLLTTQKTITDHRYELGERWLRHYRSVLHGSKETFEWPHHQKLNEPDAAKKDQESSGNETESEPKAMAVTDEKIDHGLMVARLRLYMKLEDTRLAKLQNHASGMAHASAGPAQ